MRVIVVDLAAAIISLTAKYLHGLPNAASLGDNDVLTDIGSKVGRSAMILFALGLVEAGLIAAISSPPARRGPSARLSTCRAPSTIARARRCRPTPRPSSAPRLPPVC